MRRYRSKPQEVEAVLWDDEDKTVETLWEFTGQKIRLIGGDLWLAAGVDGAQGSVFVPVWHYVVRKPGDTSDIWPVDAAYFAAKYEEVEA